MRGVGGVQMGVGLATRGRAEVEGDRQVKRSRRAVGTGGGWLVCVCVACG